MAYILQSARGVKRIRIGANTYVKPHKRLQTDDDEHEKENIVPQESTANLVES